MITETAPAKINLYLHIGPVRDDGLHELASLFVFAENGDKLGVEPAHELSLKIKGPFADALEGAPVEDNLVFRAAALLKSEIGEDASASITLEKNLPVAAGIGGGSADAAAALRALIRLWECNLPDEKIADLAFQLGADVPACLTKMPINVTGAGEKISKGPALPPLWICLVNPGAAMPTGPIFCAFDEHNPAPPAPLLADIDTTNIETVMADLNRARNDLEKFAYDKAPIIGEVISYLAHTPGALLSRMSGSGATVFALYAASHDAERAAGDAKARGWWSLASRLCVS